MNFFSRFINFLLFYSLLPSSESSRPSTNPVITDEYPPRLSPPLDPMQTYRHLTYVNITILGIDNERLLVHPETLPYQDGLSCTTGQLPYNADELLFIRRFEMREAKSWPGVRKVDGYWDVLDPYDYMGPARAFDKNCANGECHYWIELISFVCGPKPIVYFPDGANCVDGSMVRKWEPWNIRHPLYDYQKQTLTDSIVLTSKMKESASEYFNEKYRYNCAARICKYDYERGAAICGSTDLRPFRILVFVMLSFIDSF